MAGVQIDGVNNKIDFDDDADTSISSNTDDTLVFEIAGATDFTMTANTFTAASGSTIASQALTATTVTASGIIKTDDTTAATSTTDGSLQTDGGLSVALDAVVGDDLYLKSDAAVIHFGTDSDTTLTHSADEGLTLDSGSHAYMTINGDASNKAAWVQLAQGGTNRWLIGCDASETDYQWYDRAGSAVRMRLSQAGTLTHYGAAVFNESSADVDFRVESNGNANMIFVDGGSDHVNIGTASDLSATLNVAGTAWIETAGNEDTLTLNSTDADASGGPKLNLQRNSASPADGDVIGTIGWTGKDDSGGWPGYVLIEGFIGDASNTSEDGRLKFSILKDGTARSICDMTTSNVVFNQDSQDIDFRIESDGNANMFVVNAGGNNILMGSGTDAYSSALQVTEGQNNTRVAYFRHNGDNSSEAPFGIGIAYAGSAPDSTSASEFITCLDTGTTRFVVASDGDCYNHDNAYNAISDERIKESITDANSQWDDIKGIKVRNFKKKDDVRAYGDDAKVQIGVVAQELELTSPKLVTETGPSTGDIKSDSTFGTLYEDGDVIPEGKQIGDIKSLTGKTVKGVRYSVLYMKAIKALQEAQTRIETLETKVAALEG